MRVHWICSTLLLICFGIGATFPVMAGTYITFDVPGASGAAIPEGVNKWGTVTGYYYTSSPPYIARGFVFQSSTGKLTTFAVQSSSANATFATSINDSGVVVGYYSDPTAVLHGFIRNPQYTILDVPGSSATQALSINNAGEIAGIYYDSAGGEHGFIRDALGNYTTFDVPGGLRVTSAVLNDRGAIAGNYQQAKGQSFEPAAYVRDASGNVTSFTVTNATSTYITGINASSQVTGLYYIAGVYQPFFRDQNGVITTYNIPGFTGNAGIEDNGTVVGSYYSKPTPPRGWKMTSAGVLTYFKDPNAGDGGTVATCVSHDGRIAGNYVDSNNVAHNFVSHS